jgi:energy-coupling factor transport system ATP-binding protein
MTPIVQLRDLRFAFTARTEPVFDDLQFDIAAGSFTLLIGPSGSGKSTMLRVFNGLVPHFSGGRFGGSAVVAGRDIRTSGPRQMSEHVGFVFQDPEPQMIAGRVDDEICFGLEQRGIPRHIMRQRLEDVLDALGIAHLRERSPQTLSGGEQQRVAIAAAMSLQPDLLILDEPTSQLDPAGADAVIEAVTRMHDDLGITTVIAEHRLDRLLHRVDRVRGIDGQGRVVVDDIPAIAARSISDEAMPAVTRLGKLLGWSKLPLTVKQARIDPRLVDVKARLAGNAPATPAVVRGRTLVRVQDVSVNLQRQRVLAGIDLEFGEGEAVAIMGRNGSGKSTLLRSILGFQKPSLGTIRRDEAIATAYLPQQPGSIFFHETVADEITWTLQRRDSAISVEQVLAEFDLSGMASVHPRDLSGGERERAAMAAVLAGNPPIIVLDEPTRGMDASRKRDLVRTLGAHRELGALVIVATHDVELVASLATRVIVLGNGDVIADGHPREVLAGSMSLAPQVNRLFGSTWLSVEDVWNALAPS